MAAKKLGTLIKEARTNAGLTQEQLARKIPGVSAADISKAERGNSTLTQSQLRDIARATGVTQSSLIKAAKGSSSAKKTDSKKSSSAKSALKLSATEKKLVELYREADTDTRKAAMSLLKGENSSSAAQEIIGELLENAMEMLGK